MFTGLDRETGNNIGGIEHLKQSVTTILTTPLGSRVMRRDFGSILFELIDSVGNEAGKLKSMVASVDALRRHEPRLVVRRVRINVSPTGRITIDLYVTTLTGEAIELLSIDLPFNQPGEVA